jgi:MFS family permease
MPEKNHPATPPNPNNHLILTVYLPSLIMAISNGMLIPIMPLYARSFEVSYGLIGIMLAAEGIGNLAFDVPAGVIIQRLGHKKVMLIGVSCTILGHLALVWAQDMVEVIAYLLLAGSGSALWSISRHAYIADLIQVQRRGRSIAVLGGIGRIGVLIGPALGGFIGATFGLRAPFLVFAALALVGALAVLFWVQEESRRQPAAETTTIRLWDVLRTHYRPLLTAGSGQLCAQLIRAARHIIIPLYGADILGLDIQSVGLIISLSAATDVLMFYPAGLIMDRFGRKYAYVPSFIIQSFGMAMIPLTGGFTSLLLVAMLIGLGNGLGSGTMMTLGADLAPHNARGTFLGMWRFIGDSGGAGGPLVVGGVATVLGLTAAPVVIAGIGVVGVAILGWLVPETLGKKEKIP